MDLPSQCVAIRRDLSRSWARAAVVIVAFLAGTAGLTSCARNSASLADYIAAICGAPFKSASAEEQPYLSDNVSAMTKMMVDMGIRPTGDVDHDFVSMMVPHHQGAIEMAQAELRYGRNERLRRMAQEIIVTQQQEIVAMRFAIGQPLPPSVPAPDQVSPTKQTAAISQPAAPGTKER